VSDRTRVVVVALVGLICFSLPLWIIVQPGSFSAASGSRLFIGLVLVFCIVPLYPLYRKARSLRWSIAAPLFLVIGALVLTAAVVFVNFVFHLETPWVAAISDLRTGAVVIACVWFIRNAVIRGKSDATLNP
jgi:hypothetical protein